MSRGGLKRLACPNGCPSLGGRPFGAYMTVAQIEHGMRPVCPGCGAACIPEDPELWGLVPFEELQRSVAFAEYGRRVSDALHGQASHVQRGRPVRPAETVALEGTAKRPGILRELERERHARRLSGLRQYAAVSAAASAAAESIPF